MKYANFVKYAERAIPVIETYGPIALRFYAAWAARSGGVSGAADAQPRTKAHYPDGGPIGYGDDGQYLSKTHQYGGPTKH